MESKTLQEALVEAQKEMVNPKRSKTAKVEGKTKDGTPYKMTYSYATLDDTMDAALKALNKHGIALLQPMVTLDDGRIGVRTIILGYGEQIDLGVVASRANDDPQKNGSILTYYRRYGLGALGLVAEDDDDGAAGRIQDAPKEADPTKAELGRLVALAKVNGTNDAMKAWFADHDVPATVTGFKSLTQDALADLHAVVAPVAALEGACPTCNGTGAVDGERCDWCDGTGRV